MEGELLKWTNYVLGWRERYFVLKGSVLLYYIKKGDKIKGKIHLSVSSLNATSNDYRFEIDTGTSIFYLRAHTKEKKNEWVKAIKLAKFEAESKMQNNPEILNSNINGSSRMINEMENIGITRLSMLPDDILTKKVIFIKTLTDNLAKLNLDFDNFLQQNKKSFSSEISISLNEFLNTYRVRNR